MHNGIRKKNPLKGFPDVAGLLPNGVLFALELKSRQGKLSPEQKAWIEDLSTSGAKVAVIKSFEEAKLFIETCLKEI